MDAYTEFTVEAARAAAENGDLQRWVVDFLASEGSDNEDLAEQLRSDKSLWMGPVELPFDELHRLAGPPDQPTLSRLKDDDLETVEGMQQSIEEDGWEPAPMVASYRHGQVVLEDGNHRVEGLRRAGHDDYWVIMGFDDEQQRDAFLAAFPTVTAA